MIKNNNDICTKERGKPLAELKEKFYFQLCRYSSVCFLNELFHQLANNNYDCGSDEGF